MAKAQDYTKALNDLMGAFPVDMSVMQDAFKNSAVVAEKMASVALNAAEKSTEVSAKWTQETLSRLGDVSKAKADPADYGKAVTDYASATAETASENIAAFAEIAKRVQMETVELMLAVGQDVSKEATSAVKKATDEVTKAAKKATAAK